MNSAKKIFQILFSQTKDFVFFLVYSFLSSGFALFEVLVTKNFIDNVISTGKHANTSWYVGLFILGMIAFVATVVMKSRTKTILTTNVTIKLAKDAYESVMYADISECNKDETKKKVDKILENSDYIGRIYLRDNCLKVIDCLITITILFFAMLFIKPVLSLIVLIAYPIYFALELGLEKIITLGKTNHETATANFKGIIDNNFNNVKSIKLLNSIAFENERFDDVANEYLKAKVKKNSTTNLSGKVLAIIYNSVLIAIMLGLCGFMSANENYNITGGVVFSFLVLVPYSFITFRSMISCNIISTSISSMLQELQDLNLLRTEKKTEPVSTLEDIHSIKFKDVSFILDNGLAVANNINFELKRGEKLGILSYEEETREALFNMLIKLTKPKEGEISINNCDISKINTEYLRSIVTSVYTRGPVIDASICDNVIYPLEFDEYKYNDALNRSGVKDIINTLPDKDQTNIYDKKVSDDLLQRIVFANAFFKDSKIYLLKDATNEMETSSEIEMVNEVSRLKNKIVITITDRVYCLNKYDKVLVLKQGEVLEYGTYDELMKNKTSALYKLTRKPSTKLERIAK